MNIIFEVIQRFKDHRKCWRFNNWVDGIAASSWFVPSVEEREGFEGY